jgi:ankyrin repeat protein
MGPDIRSIKVLLKYGANVNAKNTKGETLLALAVRKNNCYLTDVLLAAGADPSQVREEDIKKARPYIRWRIKQALLKQKEKNRAKK